MSVAIPPRRFFITLLGACLVMFYQVAIMHMKYESDRSGEMYLALPDNKRLQQRSTEKQQQRQETEPQEAEQRETEPQQQQENGDPCATTRVPKSHDLILEEYLADTEASNSSTCSSLNTEAWLKGPRFGNARDPLMTPEMIQQSILEIPRILHPTGSGDVAEKSVAQTVLGTSLCYANSRFLKDSESALDDKSVRLWAVRLVYLAIHYHQHRLAIPEAKLRYRNRKVCPQELLETHNVGQFDYECGKNVKYLVVTLAGNGIGSNVRAGAVVGLVAGLAMNRVVLFANNAPLDSTGALRIPWPLASCDRKDYQCFFQAATPCTVTHAELMNHTEMTKAQVRAFQNKARLPESLEGHKVIRMSLQFTPQLKVPLPARERLYNYAHGLIDALPCHDPRIPAMRAGADLILVEGETRAGYNYAAAAQKIQHAAAFYFMRPQPARMKQINDILQEIIPVGFDAENAAGLPIRASDKCKGESECLTFDQHIQATTFYWSKLKQQQAQQNKKSSEVSVIFTTESKAMVQEQVEFASNKTVQAKYPYSFRFVTNTKDVTPDTGFLKEYTWKSAENSADEAMLSSMTSFKFQMLPRLSIGNCCSNFHTLLNDFLMEGCGAASDNDFYCLQEHEDILLRVCCGWHHDCFKQKQAYRDSLGKNANSSNIASMEVVV